MADRNHPQVNKFGIMAKFFKIDLGKRSKETTTNNSTSTTGMGIRLQGSAVKRLANIR